MFSEMLMKTKQILSIMLLLAIGLQASAQTRHWMLMRKGNALFGKENYKEAAERYSRAEALKPEDARTVFNLATATMGQHDANAAMPLFQQAAELASEPDLRAMACYNQGYIAQSTALSCKPEEKQQYLRQAIDHYKDALRANPHDDNARYNLALCQKQLKDEEKNNPQNQQNQQDQQSQDQQKQQQDQQKQQQDQQKQQQDQQKQQQDQQQPQQPEDQRDQRSPQTQQLLNLSRQAEQQTRDRVNATPRRGQRQEKNW